MSDFLLDELRKAWRQRVADSNLTDTQATIKTEFGIDLAEDGLDDIPDGKRQAVIDFLTTGAPRFLARNRTPKRFEDLDVKAIWARFNGVGKRKG